MTGTGTGTWWVMKQCTQGGKDEKRPLLPFRHRVVTQPSYRTPLVITFQQKHVIPSDSDKPRVFLRVTKPSGYVCCSGNPPTEITQKGKKSSRIDGVGLLAEMDML